ncbi:MAG: tRNA pseudouridine(38-40) synthase TruA [bacterium]|nr:tRNA pseudouridine(38-40) synthase TruA [bacterium]
MRKILLRLEYDGGAYHGWQSQKNALTIQEIVDGKLEIILRERVRTMASGRTDTGVHAFNQPVTFRTGSDIETARLFASMNSILPDDIAVIEAIEVDDIFDARRSAKKKTYRYVILNREAPSAIHRHRSWHLRKKLDLDIMQKAAALIIGEHDFSSFKASGCTSRHPIRTVLSTSFYRGDSPFTKTPDGPDNSSNHFQETKGDYIIFEITAQAFLKQMVRNIMGTLVGLGQGKIDINQFKEILDAKDRTRGGVTAPPEGLFLKDVKY